jgi:predicted acyltransferase
MVIVNNPGTRTAVYRPLIHAEWHGWTSTDLVFPFFLFVVGVSITLALRRWSAGDSAAVLTGRVMRRAVIIFGLGLVLNGTAALAFGRDLSCSAEGTTLGVTASSVRRLNARRVP